MEEISNNIWIDKFELINTIPVDQFKVFVVIDRKIIQINGAIGHSDTNYSLTMTLRKNNWIHFWRGC